MEVHSVEAREVQVRFLVLARLSLHPLLAVLWTAWNIAMITDQDRPTKPHPGHDVKLHPLVHYVNSRQQDSQS